MNADGFDPPAYWRRRFEDHSGGAAVGIASLGDGFNTWMHRVRTQRFLQAARGLSIDPATARVLDVGSGIGTVVRAWQELGVQDLVATDMTDVSVETLKRSFPSVAALKFEFGGDEPFPDDGPFDAVSALDVLFHVYDDDRYVRGLEMIASVLRPGGWFIFSEGLLRRGRRVEEPCVWRTREHVFSMLAAAGFDVVRVTPLLVVMSWPVEWRRAQTPWWIVMRAGAPLGTPFLLPVYALEGALGHVVRYGPSTKLVVCRRTDRPPSTMDSNKAT